MFWENTDSTRPGKKQGGAALQGKDLHGVAAARLQGTVPPRRSLSDPRVVGTGGSSCWERSSRSDQPLSRSARLRSTGTPDPRLYTEYRNGLGVRHRASEKPHRAARQDHIDLALRRTPRGDWRSGRGFFRRFPPLSKGIYSFTPHSSHTHRRWGSIGSRGTCRGSE